MMPHVICAFFKFLSGLTVRWSGCAPEDKQRIYFANHTSHFDFVALWTALPRSIRAKTRPVAAKDYWGCGRVKTYVAKHVVNALLIERKNISAHQEDENPIQAMLEALQQGSSLIIFPEGTRNKTEAVESTSIQPFKSGLYHLAKHCPGLELIPVYLDNLSRILPKGEFLPIPILGSATFGAPITLGPNETKPDFLSRARQAVEELKEL